MNDVKASLALIRYDDRFLVVRRRGKVEWQPPGGNLEDAGNDNPETCLLREVAENVGLDLTADTFQIADESQYIDHCKANLYFVTTTVKPDVKPGNEIVEAMWVTEHQGLQNADFTLKQCLSTLGDNDEPDTQRQRVQYSYHYLCTLKNFDRPRVLLHCSSMAIQIATRIFAPSNLTSLSASGTEPLCPVFWFGGEKLAQEPFLGPF